MTTTKKIGRPRKYDLDATTRVCRICFIEKDITLFNPNRILKNGYPVIESRCTACLRASKYGITGEEYELRIIAQGNKCAVCKQPLPDHHHIDHCHDSDVVRGILCPSCNLLLGHAHNSIEVLQGAIDYLSNPVTLDQIMSMTEIATRNSVLTENPG